MPSEAQLQFFHVYFLFHLPSWTLLNANKNDVYTQSISISLCHTTQLKPNQTKPWPHIIQITKECILMKTKIEKSKVLYDPNFFSI